MIFFRCRCHREKDDSADHDYYAGSLRGAREYAMAFLKPARAGTSEDGVWKVTISRCATSPQLHGAALVRAALNERGWMAPGSLIEIERWHVSNGVPQTLPKRKGAA
jgi:hypothetical protein